MKTKQTAVEWLEEQLIEGAMRPVEIIAIAKAMEKEQIMNANSCGFSDGINHEKDFPVNFISCEQYYNETYGKDESKTTGDPKIGTMCLFSDNEEEFNKNVGQVDILSDIDDKRMRKYISKSCDSWRYCKQIKIYESKTE